MLIELHIEDLGVIAALDLLLGPGLTALTGETGAGKTMLVEAISLLVGGRADPTVVRPGRAEARVEGRFVVGDDEVVLTRVIPVDGRSRAYVDGRLATASNLAELGARFVDLHGQHDHQSLLGTATQRSALDRFGEVDLEPLRAARARIVEIDAELTAMGGDARARAREIDLLRYQVDELSDAALSDPDEESALDRLEDVLAGAQAHQEAAARSVAVLHDDGGAIERLGLALAVLGHRGPFEELAGRLRGAVEEVADIAAEVRALGESIDDDPDRLADVRVRRQLLRDLRRKYGDTIADVIAYRHDVAGRLTELEGHDARAAELEALRAEAVAAERRAAAIVARARRSAAPRLAAEVESRVRSLAMPHARLGVAVGEVDPGDDVAFLLAANPGAPLLALSKVASGGELARAMLALRLVLSEAPDTLVFDEVDAGIGGAAASAVGESLADLARRHQVLVVTHLAQVAALASTHVVVSKRVHDGQTHATATAVTGSERTAEVARMLSGDASSVPARDHAEELLTRGPGAPGSGGADAGPVAGPLSAARRGRGRGRRRDGAG